MTMHGFEKLVLSVIPASFLVLDLLPFVASSSNENHLIIPHKYIKQDSDNHKVSPRMIFEIKLHGILLWASMGFLMPLGVLIIRMFNKEECTPRRLKAVICFHAILQILAVLLAFAGAILSIISFENSFNNTHQRIGLALYAAILVQTLIGFCRPKRGTKGRSLWYVFHWIFGTTISLVGIFNTYTGLKQYHKRTSRNSRVWSILFTAEISFMAFFYLFQEKWDYMQKQAVTSSGDAGEHQVVQVVTSSDQVDNQKEVMQLPPPQPSRKSNSLGNYFAKNNALKKLLQVT
ncbi:cytochrome b561 domain-containing protein At4g18260-like [Cynara cardunculus var. scolymus]|uniref:cytochrome b561 domain-containing protein At4g18260-like n=1 Tax=Cynara cardunculus var. scolymus TaxID=59895 RepID=UPI000D628BA9|nr:cytochrome b561 domain-containing protein At4g18260-like [Cynara cardunculus var. scolymus]